MQGGQRKGAGREFTGWAGLTKGIGTQAGCYPNPIPTLLNNLKSEGINVQAVVEALEGLSKLSVSGNPLRSIPETTNESIKGVSTLF
jgi:hypothetical protein